MTTKTMVEIMTVGVDAHKRSCTACTFEGQTKKELFEFPTPFEVSAHSHQRYLKGALL